MFARHSKETGVFCEVNNMNKDNLHFLLFSNTFLFFFFFALLEWEDSIGLMFVNDKIMSLLLKIAKMTYTTYVCVCICLIVVTLLFCVNCYFVQSFRFQYIIAVWYIWIDQKLELGLEKMYLCRTKLQKAVDNTIENEYYLSRNMGKIDKEAMEWKIDC